IFRHPALRAEETLQDRNAADMVVVKMADQDGVDAAGAEVFFEAIEAVQEGSLAFRHVREKGEIVDVVAVVDGENFAGSAGGEEGRLRSPAPPGGACRSRAGLRPAARLRWERRVPRCCRKRCRSAGCENTAPDRERARGHPRARKSESRRGWRPACRRNDRGK